MNNTCRIAAGHLGSRLARRKPVWDFNTHTLTTVGLTALWLIMEFNEKVATLLLDGNGVGARAEDSVGLGRAMVTAPSLRKLSLSNNKLGDLKNEMRKFARGLSSNTTLTHLNVASNGLGPDGVRIICVALKTCISLRVLDISYNTPGREAALAELFRVHQSLESVGVVEKEPQTRMERTFHLDARAKEAIGRALLASKTHQIRFVQCDVFTLTSKVTTLNWKTSSQSDAVMLAGVLRSNNVLTALNVGSGGELNESDRDEIGRALLANRTGKVGYCDLFGLVEGMKPSISFDLKDKDQVRSLRSFTLLAGLLRANDALKQITMRSLVAEHVGVLCEALRSNTTLETLRLEHPTRGNDMTVTNLPVQQLNGNLQLDRVDLWSAGENHVGGEKLPMHAHRWACACVGALLAENMSIAELRINPGSGSDGGGILEHLDKARSSSLRTLDVTGIGLGDRGGAKFFETLQAGMCPMLTALKLGSNKLADHAVGMLLVDFLRTESCAIECLDLSDNQLSSSVLARAIKVNKSLTSLNCIGNLIDDSGLFIMGGLLLDEDCECRIREIRTEVFEVRDGQKDLDMKVSSREEQGLNPLEVGAARLLFGVLKYNTSLTNVNLSGNPIEQHSLPDLATALRSNLSLETLDLSGTPACDLELYQEAMYRQDGDAGMGSRAKSRSVGNSSEAEEESTATKGIYALALALRESASLQVITLEGGALPVHILKGIQRIKTIDLSRQGLTFLSGIMLGIFISENHSLTELNLHSNDLGPNGLRIIAERMASLTSLNTLDLGNNIRPPGVKLNVEKGFNKGMSKGGAEEALTFKQLIDLSSLLVAIGKLVTLEKLHFDNNALSELLTIGSLMSLKVLSLVGNRLEALPEDIGQLSQLKRLSLRGNRLKELHTSIGMLGSLEALDLRGNRLLYLPNSIGQCASLKSLDVADNSLTRLEIAICEVVSLEKLEVAGNPLQKPPLSLAKQGIQPIRRYFQELAKSGETQSFAGRMVFLGHGESGKTSLQRGLRAGMPRPSEKDERTIQLDIYSLLLGEGANTVLMSMWDLAGQPQYAAGLQPYIVAGSLYLLLVPALPVAELDASYPDFLGRWMDYLQVGAPDAVVQPVLTHCDRLLSPGTSDASMDRSSAAFEAAAAAQIQWVQSNIALHQAQQAEGAKLLRIQDRVMCVSCISGGDESLFDLRKKLEEMVLASPPLLPSVGQLIPKTWLIAMSYIRALRDGRNPILAARNAISQDSRGQAPAKEDKESRAVAEAPGDDALSSAGKGVGCRSYITLAEAKMRWTSEIVPALSVVADGQVFEDALQLLVNTGEIFSSSGIIYLQPDYVTRLLKPLVDHRLASSAFRKQVLANYAEANASNAHKAAGLLPAIDALVKSGELREELLPLLWEPLGLHRDDYGDVLLMLSASGVLFLAEHTQQDRRWVMPMRLSETQPPDVKEEWNDDSKLDAAETLSIRFRLGRIAPPGITERLMASCYGFGKYHRFWKRGALIQNRLVSGSQLLLELKVKPNSDGATSAKVDHELLLEVRGEKTNRAGLWAVLLQMRKLADLVLDDFPGLPLSCELTCPGCVASSEIGWAQATRWSALEVESRPIKCEQCNETIMLHLVKADQVPSPKPLSLAHPSAEEATPRIGAVGSELKYVGEKLRFGKPIESSIGLHKLLGIADEETLNTLLVGGETAMAEEIEKFGSSKASADEYGWTDADWLHYLRDERAAEHKPPRLLEEYQAISSVAPVGHAIGAGNGGVEGFEKGHNGMKLDDFVAHPVAQAAGLKRHHVLALRLYSSSVFRSINKPLHDGCTLSRPHPYPAVVAQLTEAVRKLRSASARAVTAAKEAGTSQQHLQQDLVVWRGICNMGDAEFKQRGGTEVALLSASKDRPIAEQYALRAARMAEDRASVQSRGDAHNVAAKYQKESNPTESAEKPRPSLLLLKLKAADAGLFGADIAFCSVFPHERELVYPPCTYLEAKGDHDEQVADVTMKVIDVVAHCNYL